MSKYKGEQVLVVPRTLFDTIGAFNGAKKCDVQTYIGPFLQEGNAFFMDRAEAEADTTHKQLIPYVIFTYQDKILHYTRGGSGNESRLHDKGSIGIGGHINPIDNAGKTLGLETYLAGVLREIEEELIIPGKVSPKIIGLINDDSNDVGSVHLGVIHHVELDSMNVSAHEEAIAKLSFYSLNELKSAPLFNKLETWSQLCLSIID